MATKSSFQSQGEGSHGEGTQGEGKRNSGHKAPLLTLQPNPATTEVNRRRVGVESGRALEILGHAIEYLADEYAFSSEEMGLLESGDPRVEAIQLLMSLNRQVYYACPVVEPGLRRLAGWLLGGASTPHPKHTSL